MLALGLLFKWINVGIILGYIVYHTVFKIIPDVQKSLAERRKKRLERLATIESFKQQSLAMSSAMERQQLVVEQLTSKIAQWHSYEMEAKKKLQTIHSKIYYDAKKRIERQTAFLQQHSVLSASVNELMDAIHQELCMLINQQEHSKYAHALVRTLKKETHGL